MSVHWFWLGLTVLVVVWYATITVYVAFRGARDIRGMLRRLGEEREAEREAGAGAPDA